MNCPACETTNAADSRFCVQCGARMAAAPTCRACGTQLASGAKFCTSCGTTVAAAPELPQGPGYVVDGEWHRAPGELVRKVPGDALRSSFGKLVGGLDWGAFFNGTLVGKVLDTLMSKNIRVPMGSVAVVVRDGVVTKILPPGEQTTAGLLRDLIAGEGMIERMTRPESMSLYLVDRRPIPISFTTEIPVASGTKTLQSTTLLGVGVNKDALSAFLSDVVADKDTLSAEDLYVRFRAEIERSVNDALRARPNVADAEKAAKDALRARFGAKTGLSFDLVIAPRHTVHRLDRMLGSGDNGLLCADGSRIEIDLVLSVQSERAPAPPDNVLASTASRYLRDRRWADVKTSDGLAALETELQQITAEAMEALGSRLLSLQIVDVRSAGAQWELGSRAEMAQARAEARIGREWLSVRDDETALAELTAASELKGELVRRDATFAARRASVDDARRHAALEAEERAIAEQKAQGQHDVRIAGQSREHEAQLQSATNRGELEQKRMTLESERRRKTAEDEAHVEKLRREARLAEVTAMADLEAKMTEQEQQHRIQTMERLAGQSEAQMLAMQASDLATKEHGAAFAEALGKLGDGERAKQERARADEVQREAMKMIQDLAKTTIEANAKVATAKAGAPSGCPACGASLKPGARFCAECGTASV